PSRSSTRRPPQGGTRGLCAGRQGRPVRLRSGRCGLRQPGEVAAGQAARLLSRVHGPYSGGEKPRRPPPRLRRRKGGAGRVLLTQPPPSVGLKKPARNS